MASSPRFRFTPALGRGLAVGVLGLCLTAAVVFMQWNRAQTVAHTRFTQSADAFAQALTQRLDAYLEISYGLRNLFVANPALGRRAFMEAAERLAMATRHPEIKNLAFTRYVMAQDKAAFEQAVRVDTSVHPEGYPRFAIRPPGMRPEYFVADYLWPMDGNQGVHGLDISAQPANLASMHYSQTTGKPVASGPFDLLQESKHRTGFVVRVPVFRSATGTATSPAGGASFLGAVAVTLRVWDIMERMRTEGQLQGLALYLSDRGADYAGQGFTVNIPLFVSATPQDSVQAAAYQRDLSVFGRVWRMEINPTEAFLSPSERQAPWWLAIGGTLLSVLLGIGVFRRARRRMATPDTPTPPGEQPAP